MRKESIIQQLKLPQDIMIGAMKITIMGNTEIWIENYRGIIEYTDSKILLQGKQCQACIEGKRLRIDYYTNEDMKVCGLICSVQLLNHMEN